MNLKIDANRKRCEKITLTERQEKWLKAHYKNTKNDVIMEKLGLSHSTLHRRARELGLKKTKQFCRKMSDEALRTAWEVNKANNWPPKGYRIPRSEEFGFKKDETNVQRFGAKREAERRAKAQVSMRRTRREERARVMFGLEQKTKLRFNGKPHAYYAQCSYLRKRGYEVDEANKVAYWDENTKRSPRYEARKRGEGVYFDFKPKTIEQAI